MGLIILLIGTAVTAAGIGAMHISPQQVIAILLKQINIHIPVTYDEGMANVLWQIRLPRVIAAILIGSGLAVAGAAMQGLFRNPMADPTLIGISFGASFFAVLTIVVLSSLPFMNGALIPKYYLLNVTTFAGACFTSFVVFRLSKTGGRSLITTLLLSGLAINALCRALTDLVTYVANDEQLRSATYWTMGSLGGVTWSSVWALLPFILVPIILLPRLAKSLNVFALGEQEAAYLGVKVKRLKAVIVVLTTLLVGASVAIAGVIGFVGLIVPHMLRSITGSDHRSLLPNCALLGATLLTMADVVSRTIIAPAELPIGIVTAVIGTPIFVVLLVKQKKQLRLMS
ncbi:iron ABC transporter permease [Niastella caeni]|uniref:Iron ABC transporter permease n=1 Tax=Niastella caeni TaxID=2569763 RepID=A0A4S8HR53_9BACT|nr:iron ABC transporter permease [Niastella caeni]